MDGMSLAVTYARANRRPKQDEKEWPRAALSGPALIENIVQGLCHDLLRIAQAAAEEHPLFIPVFHVHDELVCEVDRRIVCPDVIETYEKDIMLAALGTQWAHTFPLACETEVVRRYTK